MSNETPFFTTILQEYDALEDITLHPLSKSSLEEGYLVYRIQRTDGVAWVARAYRRDRHLSDWFRFFYPWATSDPAERLSTRAATLLCLEQQHYLVPRVLRTRTGGLLAHTVRIKPTFEIGGGKGTPPGLYGNPQIRGKITFSYHCQHAGRSQAQERLVSKRQTNSSR